MSRNFRNLIKYISYCMIWFNLTQRPCDTEFFCEFYIVCEISHFCWNYYRFTELSVDHRHIALFTEILQIHRTFIYLAYWRFHGTIIDSWNFHWLMSIRHFFQRTRSVTHPRNYHEFMELLQIHRYITGLSWNLQGFFQDWYLARSRNYFGFTELSQNPGHITELSGTI